MRQITTNRHQKRQIGINDVLGRKHKSVVTISILSITELVQEVKADWKHIAMFVCSTNSLLNKKPTGLNVVCENGECSILFEMKRKPQSLRLFFDWVELNRESWEHYGQRIKRRATYLLRIDFYFDIKWLKFSLGLFAQPQAIEFCGKKSGYFFCAKIFFWETL